MTNARATTINGVPKLVVDLLRRRGLSDDETLRFVYPDYARDLHDPFLMSGMREAVARVVQAAAAGERVVVYGDYDIDGMTASAIMIEGLAAQGITATSYIPDRFEEGYGINLAALEQLAAEGVTLVVSVDCGITSVAEAAWAREHGLDVIITDHHNPPPQLPEAVAVVNPKQPGDEYPFKDLCGAGVAFKLVQALQTTTGQPAAGQEKWLLDLVALGTVCDVVNLVDENRTLVSYGLKVLRQTRRPGLVALAHVAGVQVETLSSYHLGYVLGPRMNAAGRLEHASKALELLQTNDAARAIEIATELDTLNLRRRDEQGEAFEAASLMAEARPEDLVLVLADSNWSHGIVGIVASKLVEAYHKPTLVAQIMGETTKGSARSVGSFNMVEALRANSHLLTKFGGHFFAAGYTLPTENIAALRAGLADYFVATGASADRPAEITPDLEIDGLGELTWTTYEALGLLEPHGAGNPAPVLAINRVELDRPGGVGKDRQHLRTGLRDQFGVQLGAIGFGLASQKTYTSGDRVRVCGRLDVNEYLGKKSLQVIITSIENE
ncbi:single-stranded-DNA-specific exonuclease RecJ [Candidatus Saccharibacteria bacterium]|nr:single-stranded-DNA-specific exonuclease RecJ [Candidatus Saccharibacteria bacterium]